MQPVIFRHITHNYSGTKVLDDVSIAIEENAITAVIGRSGSGKSTFLQIINGLVVPSNGEIDLFGEPLRYGNIHATRLHIGYAVQGTGLFPHMTVYENISLLARINGKDPVETEQRVSKLMGFVNLPSEFKSKYPYQLSGGEQQRVGICRAMILNPKLFLLDEAFGALDPATKNEIHTELLTLQKNEPRTIIFVTHDLHEAIRLADRIIVLEKGVVQQYGTADEVVNHPANASVKDFIESQRGLYTA
jgi:osmoprotectant transport system ATP-binding protein